MCKQMNDENYIKATTKNLYLDRPFKSMEKYTDKPVNQQIADYFKDMGLLKEYIKETLIGMQSHVIEPAYGDVVVNTNPGCKHYKSVGIVKTVNELPRDAGKTVTYVCTNSGANWNKGDELTKTMDQLSISEYVISDSFKYHILENISVIENVFRPGSKKFFDLIKETRKLYLAKMYTPIQEEIDLLDNYDTGEFGMYENELVPLDFPRLVEQEIDEAKYKGKEVKLGAKGAKKTSDGRAYVYVKDPKTGNVKKVTFGSSMPDAMGDSEAHKKRRKSFGDRHNCSDKKDKTKAGYWACRATKMFGRNIPGWW